MPATDLEKRGNERPWVEETLRLNRRYVQEVVERFQLCPWAKPAREASRIVCHVHLQRSLALTPALGTLSDWSRLDEVEVGLLIFPRFDSDVRGFQHFANQLIDSDRRRWGQQSSPFAMAAFHPDAHCDVSNADRLVPFLRRTPDPTIQVVWIRALERVRGQEVTGTQFVDLAQFRFDALPPPSTTLRERISRHNLSTVREREHELSAVLNDIHQDRRLSHARLEREAPLQEPGEEHHAGTE